MRKAVKITIFIIVLVAVLSVWMPFLGIYASGVGSTAFMVEEYIEANNRFPQNMRELESFHDFKINNAEINFDISLDDITAKGKKLYIDNNQTWLIKPKGTVRCLIIGPFIPKLKTDYSYKIYESYKENKDGSDI
jgi:hypothetical protein